MQVSEILGVKISHVENKLPQSSAGSQFSKYVHDLSMNKRLKCGYEAWFRSVAQTACQALIFVLYCVCQNVV